MPLVARSSKYQHPYGGEPVQSYGHGYFQGGAAVYGDYPQSSLGKAPKTSSGWYGGGGHSNGGNQGPKGQRYQNYKQF